MVEAFDAYAKARGSRRSTFWSIVLLAAVVLYLPILLIMMQGGADGTAEDNFIPLLMVIGSAVALLLSWAASPRAAMTISRSRPLGWLLLYLAYLALITSVSETFISKTPIDKLRELLMLGVYLSPGVAIYVLVQRPQRMQAVLFGVRGLGWLVLGTFAYGLVFGASNEAASVSRVFGIYGDSVAWVASFFIILSLAYRRWLELGAFVVMIALSGSMGAAIAGAAGILFHLLLLVGRKRLNLFYIICAALLALIAVQFVDLSKLPVVERLFSDDQRAFSLNARFGAFGAALDIARDHPVLGVGFSGFFEAALGYDVERYFDIGFSLNYVSNAQNQYLQVLSEAGILGLVLFVVVLVSTARGLYRLEEIEDPHLRPFMSAAFAWVTAIALTNQTAVWLLPHSVNTVLFAIILGAASARRQLLGPRLTIR